MLIAPTSPGTATVTASVEGFSTTTTVTFGAGPPATVQLSPLPATINIGGTATLTTTVLDAQNNPVAGQTLTFTPLPTHGTLSVTSGVTDSNGRLTVTYTGTSPTAPNTPDAVRVRTVNAITDSVGLTVVSAPVTGITASAGAASVVADGASTVAIRATVTVASGSPAGLPVSFTTTTGSFAAAATTAMATT